MSARTSAGVAGSKHDRIDEVGVVSRSPAAVGSLVPSNVTASAWSTGCSFASMTTVTIANGAAPRRTSRKAVLGRTRP